MNIEEAKKIFKEKYSASLFELVDEHQEELFFKNRRGIMFRANKEELQRFADFDATKTEFSNTPNECSMCSADYREQVISFGNRNRSMFTPLRNSTFTFGKSAGDQVYCEISEASSNFKNYFRFCEPYFEVSANRARHSNPYRGSNSENLENILFSPTTIKIYRIKASSVEEAVEKSDAIVDSVLFTLSYLRDITLTVDEEWPRRMARIRRFSFGGENRDTEFSFPKAKPISSLVRFYQRGMSSDDPVNAFLSFYQCLEYFFVTVSDELLYQKLTRRINDPKFQLKPRHLDRIIQDTMDHKRESDETEMLKAVLQKFIDAKELIEFIKSYEAHLGDNRFTKKRKLFGEESEIRLNEGHVISNVAARIKSVRNSLVHSSDRYKRQDIFVPTTQNESIIQLELPIVKYLAERVVIGSSTH